MPHYRYYCGAIIVIYPMTSGISNSVLFTISWETLQLDELDHAQGTE